jgi:CRISPR-associated protein Cas1
VAAQLSQVLAQVEGAASVPEAMGYEGRAAALYFPAYGACFVDDDVRFEQRSRRPPRDPANALLSLGYMLVLAEVAGALAGEGLHLGLGFLHEVSPRRPALPLDVLELFRQPVVDRLALSVLNRRALTAESFERWPDGKVLLKEAALKRYLLFYERAMTTPFQQPGGSEPATFRALIRDQARALRRAIEGGQPWTPLALEL